MDISTCGVCLESTSDAICCILPDILDDSLEDAHKFCSDCTEKYIEVATFAQPLAEKSMGFPCMELDCDRIIPYESFSGMINETTREHFLERYKREIEEQRKEKTKEEHMKDEIEILQNQISKSLTLTCRACGVQYLKIDGCNVVKCRCGKKQCGLCGKLFESQFDSVHMNEKTIDYHSLTCQNKSLTELNKDIDSLALKYDLSTNQVHEYFPHRKNEDSNRRVLVILKTSIIIFLVSLVILITIEQFFMPEEQRWQMSGRLLRLILEIGLELLL